MTTMRALLILFLAALLAGCGFQLRGQSQLPFTAAYVEAAAASPLGVALRHVLEDQGKLTEGPDAAPVRIRISSEKHAKNILSLSGGGKVREYRLEYRVDLAAHDKNGGELMAPANVHLTRDFSYNDDQILAKEKEEASLKRAMEQEALRQLLRRLSYIKH